MTDEQYERYQFKFAGTYAEGSHYTSLRAEHNVFSRELKALSTFELTVQQAARY